jgi:hypothetical protein
MPLTAQRSRSKAHYSLDRQPLPTLVRVKPPIGYRVDIALWRTPLHRSAGLGYGAATKLLVGRGTVVDAEDNNGRTARF